MVCTGSQPHTMMARSMVYPSSDNCCARAFRAPKSATLRSCCTAGGWAAQYASISFICCVCVAVLGGVLAGVANVVELDAGETDAADRDVAAASGVAVF